MLTCGSEVARAETRNQILFILALVILSWFPSVMHTQWHIIANLCADSLPRDSVPLYMYMYMLTVELLQRV